MALKAKAQVVLICLEIDYYNSVKLLWQNHELEPTYAVGVIFAATSEKICVWINGNDKEVNTINDALMLLSETMLNINYIPTHFSGNDLRVCFIASLDKENNGLAIKRYFQEISEFSRINNKVLVSNAYLYFSENLTPRIKLADELLHIESLNSVCKFLSSSKQYNTRDVAIANSCFIEEVFYCVLQQNFHNNIPEEHGFRTIELSHDNQYNIIGMRRIKNFAYAPIYIAIDVLCGFEPNSNYPILTSVESAFNSIEKYFDEKKVSFNDSIIKGLACIDAIEFRTENDRLKIAFGDTLERFFIMNTGGENVQEKTFMIKKEIEGILQDKRKGFFDAQDAITGILRFLELKKKDYGENAEKAQEEMERFESRIAQGINDIYIIAVEWLRLKSIVSKYSDCILLCDELLKVLNDLKQINDLILNRLHDISSKYKEIYLAESFTGMKDFEDYCVTQLKDYNIVHIVDVRRELYSQLYNWHENATVDFEAKILKYFNNIIRSNSHLSRNAYVSSGRLGNSTLSFKDVEMFDVRVDNNAVTKDSVCCFVAPDLADNSLIKSLRECNGEMFYDELQKNDLTLLFYKTEVNKNILISARLDKSKGATND